MNNGLFFINDSWFWPILCAAILLWVVFLWKEWVNTVSLRFLIKAGIALLGITALVMIALKPAHHKSVHQDYGVVLTPGFQKGQLDSLRKKYIGLKTLRYSEETDWLKSKNDFDSLFILGNGIPQYDLYQIDSIPTVYKAGRAPSGITQLTYTAENRVGDKLHVKGLYAKKISGDKLVLSAPGGNGVDSLKLSNDPDQKFDLSCDLKVSGAFLYTLEKQDSLGRTMSIDTLPVVVAKRTPLNILILNAAPNFETKYLKDYLAGQGQHVLVQNQITRGKFSYEYLNLTHRAVNPFSREDLKSFDLLIVDASTLKNVSTQNLNDLKTAVQYDGLGIFIQTESDFFGGAQRLSNFKFERDGKATFTFSEWQQRPIDKFPYRFNDLFGTEPIFRESENSPTAYQRKGKGRIGASTLNNTYQLLLDGHQTEYAFLWSKIVENVAKRIQPKWELEINDFPIYVDEPLHFTLRTSIMDPELRTAAGSVIPLKQNPDLHYIWSGTAYPQKTGWHEWRLAQDTIASCRFYVGKNNQFKSLRAANTIFANKRFFDKKTVPNSVKTDLKPIKPLWFYLLFIICIAYLWLEPKLFGRV